MDIKDIRPKVFAVDPQSSDARKQWSHWFRSFGCYVQNYENISDEDKLSLLVNRVDALVYEIISEENTYDNAICKLQDVYVKSPNSIFARYLLRSCKQQASQTVDEYFQKLNSLSTDCNFTAVAAAVHEDEAIRDTFISGLASSEIRRLLVEESNLTLQATFDKARSLEIAHKNAELFNLNASCEQAHQVASVIKEANLEESTLEAISGAVIQKCSFCGNKKHSRRFCPARDLECYRCGKKGHFAKVCRSFATRQNSSSSAALMPIYCGNENNSKVKCLL